ncbi:methyltransferase domain-containing protein, partial [bacterium]|nr:methyltransferase domain-containing protein [bacterium]
QLWDLSRNYDIVHCHNEPDILTVAALAGDAPVIHDTHDLISLRANADPNLSYFEGVANRGASGRVYTTPYQMEEAQKLYGVNGPSLVFYNYVSQSDLLKSTLPKRSAQDGKVHIVYEGGIGENGHRDFSSLFVELAKEGIHIHIYPTFYSREIARGFSAYKTIHYYQPLSPRQIMEEMTQYDFGIIPFNLEKGNRRFLDSTIANKLFEYMAAGLPVIASSLQSYIDYFKKTPIGITFENAEDIIKNIPKLKEIAETTDFSKLIFTYEGEIERLESFYLVLINGCSTNGRAASGRAFRAEPRPSGYRASIEYADSQEFYSQEDRVRNRRKKEKNPNFYDELFSSGGWQNEYHKHYTESIYYSAWSRALEWIKQIPNPKIIEVGCGPGQLANMFFDNEICDYRGIDFSAVAIEMAKENNKMHPDVFMVDNAYNSEIFSSDYNTVVLLEVLEHIDNDLLVLNKIRKNAHVIFSVPNYYSYSHMRWFDSKDEILERYGNIVDIESIFETNFRPTQNKIYLVKGIKG